MLTNFHPVFQKLCQLLFVQTPVLFFEFPVHAMEQGHTNQIMGSLSKKSPIRMRFHILMKIFQTLAGIHFFIASKTDRNTHSGRNSINISFLLHCIANKIFQCSVFYKFFHQTGKIRKNPFLHIGSNRKSIQNQDIGAAAIEQFRIQITDMIRSRWFPTADCSMVFYFHLRMSTLKLVNGLGNGLILFQPIDTKHRRLYSRYLRVEGIPFQLRPACTPI